MCAPAYQKILKGKYNDFYTILYNGQTNVTPAEIDFEISDEGTSGYDRQDNIIYIRLAGEDLEDFNTSNIRMKIPTWERELLHEMIHQYQFKHLTNYTSEGERLFNLYQLNETVLKSHNGAHGFNGNGHDAIFYTAIHEVYLKFANSVEDFILKYI